MYYPLTVCVLINFSVYKMCSNEYICYRQNEDSQ